MIETETFLPSGPKMNDTSQFKNGEGQNTSVTLPNSGVTPGSYTNANITVAANGTVTAAANGSGGTSVLVQRVNTQTGAVNTGTTTIPIDDSIPQKTEGDEYMTLAITPTSTTNKLEITVTVHLSPSVTTNIIAAIFQDTGNDALAVQNMFIDTNTATGCLTFSHTMTAGTTSATTFKIRCGMANAGTLTFNGQSGARKFGGVLASSITIEEILV